MNNLDMKSLWRSSSYSAYTKTKSQQGGLERGLPDVFTFNTLIDGYCERLKLDNALQLVERMWMYGIAPDVITYNSNLNGLCKAGKAKKVNDTFEEMILELSDS
jgi:pentatricopeptide repeat protein